MDRGEADRVALRAVHTVECIALGLQDGLLRLAAGARNDPVVLGPRFVDHPVTLRLDLIDLVPRRLDRVGRVDVLQHHLVDRDSHFILIGQLLESPLNARLDLLAADGQHFGYGPVANNLAHHRLVHGAEGVVEVADLEEKQIKDRRRDTARSTPRPPR